MSGGGCAGAGKLETWTVWRGLVLGTAGVGVLCPLAAAAAAVGMQMAGSSPEGNWKFPHLPETCVVIEAGPDSSLEAIVSEQGSCRQEEVAGAWGARLISVCSWNSALKRLKKGEE